MRRLKPYMVGYQEFAALYGVEPGMVSQWMSPSRRVLDPATATVVSGVRYWPLGYAVRFGTTTARVRRVDAGVRARLKSEQGDGWEADLDDELPPIVGQQEIIQVFRLPSQASLATAISTGRFPAGDWLLSGSMLWLLDTVLDAVPDLRATARSLPWDVDEDVVAALREGRYEGPGATVLTRGRHAKKGL
ncbi:hypothetical protein [Streptomyces jumonjinensis]|uniref:Uncharacterized protein n=1 Tax=Streptomyces jumonjinensis TaxID=1945 RepID=A0A646KSY7_STRJU|nr:hypothetical protein [Streptomyces jumonjinensis]MQT05439.1 hypothetical protein [Streptomyces jumonjinensis]